MTTDDRVNAALDRSLMEAVKREQKAGLTEKITREEEEGGGGTTRGREKKKKTSQKKFVRRNEEDIKFNAYSKEERDALKQFLNLTNADPQDAIDYLTKSKWNIHEATENYFHAHPDSGSVINNEMQDQIKDIVKETATESKKRPSVDGKMIDHIQESDPDSENEKTQKETETQAAEPKEEEVTRLPSELEAETQSGAEDDVPLEHTATISVGHVTSMYSDGRETVTHPPATQLRWNPSSTSEELLKLRQENQELHEKLKAKEEEIEKVQAQLKEASERETQAVKQSDTYHNALLECQKQWDEMLSIWHNVIAQLQKAENLHQVCSVKDFQPMITKISELRPPSKYLNGDVPLNDNVHLDVPTDNSKLVARRLSYGGVGDLFDAESLETPNESTDKSENLLENQPEPSYIGIARLFDEAESDTVTTNPWSPDGENLLEQISKSNFLATQNCLLIFFFFFYKLYNCKGRYKYSKITIIIIIYIYVYVYVLCIYKSA
ncbi:putative maebl [Reticulomyxa filosa]|uniref:Putative maebl n=1 Tax=Reticulomyxa filosa TaxID=46433 RepID=X6NF87_RETFI|nr:putative maebl [Reticulomyxa filosa]|eukprot:ETO24573.1 putative maebl [Reticulomyxa filosa]